jgi:ABC-2 type transport system permease protein
MSSEASGVIHDIGYRRYDGPRLGRGYAVRSLYVHGLRAAYGLGRTAKAKIFPWIMVGIVGLVASVFVVIRAETGQVVMSYFGFDRPIRLIIVLFCAVAAPELVSRDLKSGVLPLYFSRPLTRNDYALSKLAALVSAIFLLIGGAQTAMFIGGVFTLDRFGLVWGELRDLGAGLAYSLIIALVFGALSLLLASLIARRGIASAVVAGVFLFSTPLVGITQVIGGQTLHQIGPILSPLTLVNFAGDYLLRQQRQVGDDYGPYGPLYVAVAAGLFVVCTLLLLLRYRKVAR